MKRYYTEQGKIVFNLTVFLFLFASCFNRTESSIGQDSDDIVDTTEVGQEKKQIANSK